MKIHSVLVAFALCSTMMVINGQTPESGTKPDNTTVNKRDRDPGQVTADQQKNNRGDRVMTQNVRRSIMADKSLSSYAHNIKIITQNGTVTLKGPVKSEDEKRSIVEKAVAVAGSADKVSDQISVRH